MYTFFFHRNKTTGRFIIFKTKIANAKVDDVKVQYNITKTNSSFHHTWNYTSMIYIIVVASSLQIQTSFINAKRRNIAKGLLLTIFNTFLFLQFAMIISNSHFPLSIVKMLTNKTFS